jgi:hypothetical protein
MAQSADLALINPGHIVGHDGTTVMAMRLWWCRSGPCTYNRWQSVDWQLKRLPLVDSELPGPDDAKEDQRAVQSDYVLVSGNPGGSSWTRPPSAISVGAAAEFRDCAATELCYSSVVAVDGSGGRRGCCGCRPRSWGSRKTYSKKKRGPSGHHPGLR